MVERAGGVLGGGRGVSTLYESVELGGTEEGREEEGREEREEEGKEGKKDARRQ